MHAHCIWCAPSWRTKAAHTTPGYTRAEGMGASADAAARQRFEAWKRGVEEELTRRLRAQCTRDGGSSCSSIRVTVVGVSRVDGGRRRALLASTVDIETRATGSSLSNSQRVTQEIESSGSFAVGGRRYGASNAGAQAVALEPEVRVRGLRLY